MRKTICIVLALLTVLLAGCSLDLDDAEIRAETETVLDALIAGDYGQVRAGLSQRIGDAELKDAFAGMSREVAQIGAYEMSAIQWKRQVQNGEDWTAIRYLVTAGQTKFCIDVTKVAGEPGLAGFLLKQADAETALVKEPMGPAHWLVLLLGIGAGVFAVWMVVDCVRRTMKRKWLWCLMILFVTGLLTITFGDGRFAMNVKAGLYYGLSSLAVYTARGVELRIYVPVGAVIYCCMRKKLTDQPGKPRSETEAAGQVTAADEGPEAT